jgi:FkbM family methyltransferase
VLDQVRSFAATIGVARDADPDLLTRMAATSFSSQLSRERRAGGGVAVEFVRRAQKLLRLAADRRFRAGLRHGVAATVEHAGALAGRDFASVVDVGANRGQFTVFAASLYPQARIFAFEPLPGPYAVLARLAAGDQGIRTFRAAIGPHAATARLHVMHPDDSSSLLAPTGRQTMIFPQTRLAGTLPVEMAPLNAFVGPGDLCLPGLLKLDVQGFELAALAGCASLLDRFAAVYVECSFVRLYAEQPLADEVLAHLRDHRFHLTGIYNLVHDRAGRAVQADFLCERRQGDVASG